MTWWAVGAAAVGLIGSAVSSDSSRSAANKQQDATNAATAATQTAQDKALAAQQPFLDAGLLGTNKLTSLLGLSGDTSAPGYGSLSQQFKFDPGQLASDPGYQYQLQQGQNALDRKAAASGGFYSGAALQDADKLAQGLAATSYGDAYNRQLNTFQTNRADILNPLQALSGEGQTAANSTGTIQTGGANALSGLLTSNANAQGAAGIAGANALNGGINNALTAWQRQQLLNGSTTSTGGANPYYGGSNLGAGTSFGGLSDSGTEDAFLSDRRAKTDIKKVGKTDGGSNVYTFKYKGGGPTQMGVMAQEMKKRKPEAVKDQNRLLTVDYSKVT